MALHAAEEDSPCRAEQVDGLLDVSPDVERDVDLVEDLPGSARARTRLGEVVVKVDRKKVG